MLLLNTVPRIHEEIPEWGDIVLLDNTSHAMLFLEPILRAYHWESDWNGYQFAEF